MKINFNKIKINSSVGFSLYNQNIWNPIISQNELYSDNYDDCYYNRTYNQNFDENGFYTGYSMYVEKATGDKYTGDFKEGKRSGEGVLRFGRPPQE